MNEKIPANGNQIVLVAKNRSALLDNKYRSSYLAMLPDYDGWNDYSRGYFAKLLIVGENGS